MSALALGPVYPSHPTLVARVGTSRSCHKRTHAPQPNFAASFEHRVAGWNLHPLESELFAARNAAFHDGGIVELRSNRFTVRVKLNTDVMVMDIGNFSVEHAITC
jgi:hypothetical protein